jgi:hypothetical protein
MLVNLAVHNNKMPVALHEYTKERHYFIQAGNIWFFCACRTPVAWVLYALFMIILLEQDKGKNVLYR